MRTDGGAGTKAIRPPIWQHTALFVELWMGRSYGQAPLNPASFYALLQATPTPASFHYALESGLLDEVWAKNKV